MVDSLKVIYCLEVVMDLLEAVLAPLKGMVDLLKEDIQVVVVYPMVVEVDHMEEDIWEEILPIRGPSMGFRKCSWNTWY
jgi:hypothetical protein